MHPPPAAALGIDRGHTARCMHAQTRAFAAKLTHDPAPGFKDARTQKVQACVENSIEIMNDAAGDEWGELFVLRLRDADSSNAEDEVYTLEFCSRVDEDSDSESISGLNTETSVASRLNVSIAPSDQHVLLVDMQEGNTVICLRCMHLATLLRACALLIAQQLVCLCSGKQTVGLTGMCLAPETKRIYQRIFQNFETSDFVQSGNMCTGTLRKGSAKQVPQSLVAVADMLWTWYDKSAFMFHQPLAQQIRAYATRARECGTRQTPPYVHVTRDEEPLHAADGQARVNACCDCTPPAHVFAAAALPQNPSSSPQETRQVLTGVWMYKNSPLPAQMRHSSPSGAPAAFGPVPAVCHRAPAQMFFKMHELYEYRDYRLFIAEINPDTYAENWNHVLRYFPDINLEYKTIERWPNGRLMCFCIWWKYTCDVLEALRSAPDRDTMHEKLKHALLCEHIPGVSIQDFFKLKPAQIEDSHAPIEYVWSKPGTGIHMPCWISYGVHCCKIAEHAKHENTTVQNDNIFDTLLLFFILQTEYDSNHYDIFSTKVVKDAFENLAAEWGGDKETPTHSEMGHAAIASVLSGRQAFARQFEKLQAEYNKDNKRVMRDEIWSLICAPPKVNTQVQSAANVY